MKTRIYAAPALKGLMHSILVRYVKICRRQISLGQRSNVHSNTCLAYTYSPGDVCSYYLCNKRDELWVGLYLIISQWTTALSLQNTVGCGDRDIPIIFMIQRLTI